ncbi:unnamed protein product [Paramecium octaurelia]|uniref:Insulin-like growth factor binding protein, N-terminal n=1 Tax=Paramecium octaurelia TaxID=43137 RepID=A0A8S1TB09_PAROT|nr:unnamed protein product [Paramecium octaurelia]
MITIAFFLVVIQAEYVKQILRDLSDLSEFTPMPKTQACSVLNYDMVILDQQNPSVSLKTPIEKAHYFIRLYIDYMFLEYWQGDTIEVLLNNNKIDEYTYIWSDKSDQGFICRESDPQKYMTREIEFYHIDQYLELKFQVKYLNQGTTNTSTSVTSLPKLGIRNIQVNALECHPLCSSCSGPTENDCRTCPQLAKKGKVSNTCKCPISTPYIYADSCIAYCPKNTFLNEYKICFGSSLIKNLESSLLNSFDHGQNNKSSLWSITLTRTTKDQLLFRHKDSYLIGKFEERQTLTINQYSLVGHHRIRVRFNLYLFYTWAVNEYIITIIDEVRQKPLLYRKDGFINYANNDSCTNQEINECQVFLVDYYLNHTSDNLKIQIYSDTYKQSTSRWAISDFFIDALRCTENCAKCLNDQVCVSCETGYFLLKQQCVVTCPLSYTVQKDNKCLEMDEETQYSEYLLNELILTKLHGTMPNVTSYFNGYRHLGGLQVSTTRYNQKFQYLKPHYQIRAAFKVDLINIKQSKGYLSINLGNYSQTVSTDPARLYQTTTVNFEFAHSSKYLKLQIISQGFSQYFKSGISNMRIVIDYCYPTCTACTGSRIDECLQWSYDPNYDKQSNLCQLSTYFYNDSCTPCDSQCSSCIQQNYCTLCSSDYTQSGQSCYCSKGYYLDEQNTCQKCFEKCSGCLGPFQEDCFDLSSKEIACDVSKGYQIGQECNDGNYNIRDGCSNCIMDEGWSCVNQIGKQSICIKCPLNCMDCKQNQNKLQCLQCQPGYFFYQNGCFQCKSECLECNYIDQCTKCTVPTIIPLNGKCSQCETEKGYYEVNGKCQSKCGDYRQTTEEQCDDGNLIDGDGCSSKCTIETGFSCSNGICSVVQLQNNLELKYSNKTTTNTLKLDFGEYPAKCDEKYVKVYLENFDPKDFKVFLNLKEEDSMKYCQISFKFYRNVRDYDVIHVIFYKNKQRLLSVDFEEMIIQARSETFYDDEEEQQAQQVQQLQSNFVSALYFLGPGTILLGGFNFFFSILDILAWLNNFYYFNVMYPANVNIIFLNPAWELINPFDFTPIVRMETDKDYIESPFRFEQKGVDPYFLNNMMMCFVTWLLCVGLFPICKCTVFIIERIYQRSPKQKIRTVKVKQMPVFHLDQNLESQQPETEIKVEEPKQFPSIVQYLYNNAYEYQISFRAIIIKQLNLVYLDLCMASVLQLQFMDKSDQPLIFSQIFLSFIGLFICISIFLIAIKVSKQSSLLLNTKSYQFDYSTLYEGIDVKSDISKMYFSISFARKMLFIVFLVGLYHYPLFQTSFCCAASFLNVMLLLYKNPFESKVDYIQNAVPDATIFFVLVLCVVLAFDDKEQKYSSKTRTNIGWAMLSFIGLSVLTQLGLILRQFIIDIKENFQWIKSKLFRSD